MKTAVKSLALVCFLSGGSNALASDALTLTAQFENTIQVLTIEKVNDAYQGTLITNGIDVEDVLAVDNRPFQRLDITIGSEPSYSVQYVKSATQAAYTGTLSQGRTTLFFGTYKTSRSTWLYDGTVGPYDDLTGKGRTDRLDMSYGKYKLDLDAAGSGNCSGTIRIGSTITTLLSCETSGSLTDAFFTDPDHVLMWLANLFFK
jgi:hypothetical protein